MVMFYRVRSVRRYSEMSPALRRVVGPLSGLMVLPATLPARWAHKKIKGRSFDNSRCVQQNERHLHAKDIRISDLRTCSRAVTSVREGPSTGAYWLATNLFPRPP